MLFKKNFCKDDALISERFHVAGNLLKDKMLFSYMQTINFDNYNMTVENVKLC